MTKSLKERSNLIVLCREEEERLRKKHGPEYRNPIERWADEIAEDCAWLLNHSENEALGNLPFVKAGAG